MRRHWGEIITATIIILMALYVVWEGWDLPSGGGIFPSFAAICTILLSLYWIATALLTGSRDMIHFDFSFANIKPMLMLALTIGYVALIFVLGYFTATVVYLIVACLFLGVRNRLAIAATAIILMPAMYGFFVLFLGTTLPRGIFI